MEDPVAMIYRSVGSDEPFYQLVESFYARVENDQLLRPLYPADLTEPKRKLALFLIQRTGGHPTYSEERGHPRMRQRHMPFRIGMKERDAWLANMYAAIEDVPQLAAHRETLQPYFLDFATFLVNQPQ